MNTTAAPAPPIAAGAVPIGDRRAGVQLHTGTEAAPVLRRVIFVPTTGTGGSWMSAVASRRKSVPEPAPRGPTIPGLGAVGRVMRQRAPRAACRFA